VPERQARLALTLPIYGLPIEAIWQRGTVTTLMTRSLLAKEPSDRAAILAAIARVATAAGPRPPRAASIADLIRHAGDYRWVGLYAVGEKEIAIFAWSGAGPPAHLRFPRSRGLSGVAAATKQTVVSNDVARDPRYLTAFADTGSEIIIPVSVDGAVRGTVDVESALTDAFGPGDQAFLEQCAAASLPLWG
jgi:putative methionine-R-sulfoxide reductase with GAF domain